MALADGSVAGIGDVMTTRKNDRGLQLPDNTPVSWSQGSSHGPEGSTTRISAGAVHEREELIPRRARELAEDAVGNAKSWAKPFGAPPNGPAVAVASWDYLAVIAAYRDRWHVGGPGILGDEAGNESLLRAAHRERARRAGQEAAALAGVVAPRPSAPLPPTAPRIWVEPCVDL